MNILVPVLQGVNQRNTDWVCVCPSCQHERTIGYAQKWNLEKGNSSFKCRLCQINDGDIVIDKSGLTLGRKKHKYKNKVINKGTYYRNIFAPELTATPEVKFKQRSAKLGKYKNNNTTLSYGATRQLEMGRDAYKNLRKQTFIRDNFTCQMCKVRGGSLEMDHIKEWKNYPELRYELSNCRTLCKSCHKLTDNYGHKARMKNGI